jgi:hypothetical protein
MYPKKIRFYSIHAPREEFDEGTIPGSILFDYVKNNNGDGTYKIHGGIIMQYHDLGITLIKP